MPPDSNYICSLFCIKLLLCSKYSSHVFKYFFPFPQWVGNKITLNNYKPEIFELEIHTLVQSSHFTDKRTQTQISELFIQDQLYNKCSSGVDCMGDKHSNL